MHNPNAIPEDQKYGLLLCTGEIGIDYPNIETEFYRGPRDEIESLYASALHDTDMDDIQNAQTVFLVKIIKFATPVVNTAIFEDPDIEDVSMLGIG